MWLRLTAEGIRTEYLERSSRYRSQKVFQEGNDWRHSRIYTEQINPEFELIEIFEVEEGKVRVIAELAEVVGYGVIPRRWA